MIAEVGRTGDHPSSTVQNDHVASIANGRTAHNALMMAPKPANVLLGRHTEYVQNSRENYPEACWVASKPQLRFTWLFGLGEIYRFADTEKSGLIAP